MATLLTPGLYRQPALPVRATGPIARGDVALFIGYAQRGPVGVPIRLESATLFETLFGPRPLQGFLWSAVKGFFENGGAACYAMRLTDPTASAARSGVGDWTAVASFPWPMIDPRRLGRAPQATAASWVQVIEAQLRERGPRSEDPGVWGNGLTLEISRASLTRSETIPGAEPDPHALALVSLSGIEVASVLALSQDRADGTIATVTIQPVEIDLARQLVRLGRSPASFGFDLSLPIQVESVEFRMDVRLNGVLEQSFIGLAPDPRHSNSLVRILQRECRSLHLVAPPATDWTVPGSWPAEGVHILRGGADGLTAVNAATWMQALPTIARLSEPAMIAAPDLVLPNLPPPTPDVPTVAPHDCT